MLDVGQGSEYSSGYGSLFETENFLELNSVIKTQKIHEAVFFVQKFSLFFSNRKKSISREYSSNLLKILGCEEFLLTR